MGRKPISDEPKTDKPLRIRLTESERDLLDVAASQNGKNTSTWAREILVKEAKQIINLKNK